MAGLRPFCRSYLLPSSDVTVERSSGKYLRILKTDPNPSAKRGAALAFSALPVELLAPIWKDVIDALCAATIPEVSCTFLPPISESNGFQDVISTMQTCNIVISLVRSRN